MPLLFAGLVNLLGGLAAYFASVVGRKVAITAAAALGLAAITGALLLTFRTLVSPLLGAMFATQYGQVIGLAFPPISGTCIAAIAGVWAACGLYRWQKSAIALGVQS